MYYSALYIPEKEIKSVTPNPQEVEKIRSTLQSALAKAKIKPVNYNLRDISRNMVIQNVSEFTQRYAAGALSKIINGAPITNKTMLDSLFNTYAPAFNCTLDQMGYNSVMQMRDAARAGNINVPYFLDGFSKGLSVVSETFFSDFKEDKYGEEIPIDVVSSFKSEYANEVAVHTFDEKTDIRDYIKSLGEVVLTVMGHAMNNSAEMWAIGDYINKLHDAMSQKTPVVFRIGKTIYENVIIKKFTPTITNIYDLSFELQLGYNHYLARESTHTEKGYHIISGDANQTVKNMLATPEYIGPGLVEEVTLEDRGIIEAVKKVLNRKEIRVNGQTV